MLKNLQWLPVAWQLGGKPFTDASLHQGRLWGEKGTSSSGKREARGSPLVFLPRVPTEPGHTPFPTLPMAGFQHMENGSLNKEEKRCAQKSLEDLGLGLLCGQLQTAQD